MQAHKTENSSLFNTQNAGLKIAILLFISAITACTNTGLFVVNSLAKLDDYSVYENIAYGPDEFNQLNVYVPANHSPEANLPTVIFFYGGCWGGCRTYTKEHYLFVAQALTSQGYITVLTDYRRYPHVKFPEIIDDARASVEWVKSNINRFGGNPGSIYLMGHSAGAHLGAMLTFNKTYLQPETYAGIKGFIGLAGPYDFLPLTKPYQQAVFAPPSKYPESQPINFVDGQEPPLLLLYGNNDKIIKPRDIQNLSAKVAAIGGSVTSHYYDDIDHISILSALSIPKQNSQSVLNDIIRFLDQGK